MSRRAARRRRSLEAVAGSARQRRRHPGPGLAGVDGYGRPPRTVHTHQGLHRNAIAEITKRRAAAAGLNEAATGSGHCLRLGSATETIAVGVPERDVQRRGRWRSRASMDTPYLVGDPTFDATNPHGGSPGRPQSRSVRTPTANPGRCPRWWSPGWVAVEVSPPDRGCATP